MWSFGQRWQRMHVLIRSGKNPPRSNGIDNVSNSVACGGFLNDLSHNDFYSNLFFGGIVRNDIPRSLGAVNHHFHNTLLHIFEAAEIDGANGIQKFFYVTLPNLKTILLFTLVTSLIGGLQMFDIPKLYLLGGPDNATLTTSVFIYNQAFSGSYLYNRAAAASMIMFAIIAVLSAIIFFLLRDKDEIALRKVVKAQEKAYRKKMREAKKAGEGK